MIYKENKPSNPQTENNTIDKQKIFEPVEQLTDLRESLICYLFTEAVDSGI